MQEQTLQIEENNGYKNITVKTRYKWNKSKKQFEFDNDGNKIIQSPGLKPGHYVDVVKKFVEPREIDMGSYKFYSCGVTYQGEDVNFTLNSPYDAEAFANTGGEGDTLRISCVMEERLNKKMGVKVPTEVIRFEKL